MKTIIKASNQTLEQQLAAFQVFVATRTNKTTGKVELWHRGSAGNPRWDVGFDLLAVLTQEQAKEAIKDNPTPNRDNAHTPSKYDYAVVPVLVGVKK